MRRIDAVNSGLGRYKTETLGGAPAQRRPVTEIDPLPTESATKAPTSRLRLHSAVYKDYVSTFGENKQCGDGESGWARTAVDS